jgi:hypothetical protein
MHYLSGVEPFLTWLQDLPLSMWVAQSESLWAYPFILFVHTVGVALTGGSAAVILFRVLGFAKSLPFRAVRPLLPCLWTGFVLNAISGSLLFIAAATSIGVVLVFYAKLGLLFLAILTLLPVRRFIETDRTPDRDIPLRVKGFAAMSLLLWAGVVTAGRLTAYTR